MNSHATGRHSSRTPARGSPQASSYPFCRVSGHEIAQTTESRTPPQVALARTVACAGKSTCRSRVASSVSPTRAAKPAATPPPAPSGTSADRLIRIGTTSMNPSAAKTSAWWMTSTSRARRVTCPAAVSSNCRRRCS